MGEIAIIYRETIKFVDIIENYSIMKLTIFTPTFNRERLIVRLYESLLKQTSYDFEWLVVDDGSSDNTNQLFDKLQQDDVPFDIVYKKKENGGKCSAINVGVELARGDYFFIVDSDDYLTENAVRTIIQKFEFVKNDNRFCAICFLRCHPDDSCVGGDVDYDELDSDFLSYRRDLHYVGDRAEVLKTSVLREFPFPIYPNEKFLSESTVWNRIAKKYKCRYFNDKIYICEYQEGGLSDLSSQLFINNPKGSMLFYKENYLYANTFKQKLIYCSLYWRFSFSTKYNNYTELKPLVSMFPYLVFYPLYLMVRHVFHKRSICVPDVLNKRK